uniref:Retrotransposon gag protein n=1 Tax=Solanum tuberosum TaxID=4113 RepID=M1DJM3_SOLTU
MLMSCPHHHQSNEVLVHTFIEGLEPNTKILLDSAAGGQALKKTYAELFTLLNRISQGNPEWNGGGMKPVIQKTTGMLEVDDVTGLTAQIAAMKNMMNTHFNNLALGQ